MASFNNFKWAEKPTYKRAKMTREDRIHSMDAVRSVFIADQCRDYTRHKARLAFS